MGLEERQSRKLRAIDDLIYSHLKHFSSLSVCVLADKEMLGLSLEKFAKIRTILNLFLISVIPLFLDICTSFLHIFINKYDLMYLQIKN